MHFTSTEISALLGTFIWPFIRIAAMIAAMPVFSSNFIPRRVRLVIAIGMTILVAPTVSHIPDIDFVSPMAVYVALQQILIGVSMGFVFHLVFSAFIISGQIISMQMGLGFAMMVDPVNGAQAPVLSMFYLLLTTLLFLMMDGHLIIIGLVADSFHSLPIGMEGITSESAWRFVKWGSTMFIGAVLASLPAVAALMLVNVSLGVMGRAAPQMNIFAVGFAITITAGFYVMMISLSGVLVQLKVLTGSALNLIKLNVGLM